MINAMESASQESSGVRMYLLAVYYLMAGNFSLTISFFGVILVALGATVISQYHDVFAGMFGVWGATLFVFGLVMYTLLWVNKLYAQRVAS
jgi:membrane-bound ClpP family serine protease